MTPIISSPPEWHEGPEWLPTLSQLGEFARRVKDARLGWVGVPGWGDHAACRALATLVRLLGLKLELTLLPGYASGGPEQAIFVPGHSAIHPGWPAAELGQEKENACPGYRGPEYAAMNAGILRRVQDARADWVALIPEVFNPTWYAPWRRAGAEGCPLCRGETGYYASWRRWGEDHVRAARAGRPAVPLDFYSSWEGWEALPYDAQHHFAAPRWPSGVNAARPSPDLYRLAKAADPLAELRRILGFVSVKGGRPWVTYLADAGNAESAAIDPDLWAEEVRVLARAGAAGLHLYPGPGARRSDPENDVWFCYAQTAERLMRE